MQGCFALLRHFPFEKDYCLERANQNGLFSRGGHGVPLALAAHSGSLPVQFMQPSPPPRLAVASECLTAAVGNLYTFRSCCSVKQNSAPWSTAPSPQMAPPWRCMIRFAVARPMPVPSNSAPCKR